MPASNSIIEFQATLFQATEFQATVFQATLFQATDSSPVNKSWLGVKPVLALSVVGVYTAA